MLQGLAEGMSPRLMCYVSHLVGRKRGVSRIAGSLAQSPTCQKNLRKALDLAGICISGGNAPLYLLQLWSVCTGYWPLYCCAAPQCLLQLFASGFGSGVLYCGASGPEKASKAWCPRLEAVAAPAYRFGSSEGLGSRKLRGCAYQLKEAPFSSQPVHEIE